LRKTPTFFAENWQKSPKIAFLLGTDAMIFKIFLPKKSAKNLAFLTQNTLNFEKSNHNVGF
jgi:hypothetical protein